MTPSAAPDRGLARHPSIPYVAPFVVFIVIMAIESVLPLGFAQRYLLRSLATLAAILVFSRELLVFRFAQFWGSILIGVAVFAVWVGPDYLWPRYREFWLFQNSITGAAKSSAPAELAQNTAFLVLRVAGSALLVPVLEELFWRGWLMRWLILKDFRKVPLGAYSALSFWTVAVLFASEHGPYWEVGLLAGIAYNWWMIRTRSLADCILAHAVTNFCLGMYVIAAHQWQYWL